MKDEKITTDYFSFNSEFDMVNVNYDTIRTFGLMQVICDDDEFYGNAIRLYFSSKCKTENISNEEGGSKVGTFGIQKKPSKTSTNNQRKKKDSKNRTAKKRKRYFNTSLKSGRCWTDKFFNEKLEIAGKNEEFLLQDPN